MSNDLVPIGDIERMAQAIAASGLFGLKTPQQAFALMLIAQANGQHPALAARDFDIVQGRPAKKAEAMLRDFLSNGGRVEWHARTDTNASATFSHPAGGTVRIDWDIARAAQAGLAGKENWKRFPRAMLHARCVSEGVRSVFPAATGGMYTPEEVRLMPAQDMGIVDEIKPEPTGDPVHDVIREAAAERTPPRTLTPAPMPATPPAPFEPNQSHETDYIALIGEQTQPAEIKRIVALARAEYEPLHAMEPYQRVKAAGEARRRVLVENAKAAASMTAAAQGKTDDWAAEALREEGAK